MSAREISAARQASVALLSADPAGLTNYHSFDPDSFSIISLLGDPLVYVDCEGEVKPALATSWRRVSPLAMEFTLRPGVRFHDGRELTVDDVVATFHAHKHPTPSAAGKGVLGPVVCAEKVDTRSVRIVTAFPDAMLLRRLSLAVIYPRHILETQGRDALADNPLGSGRYRCERYVRRREIVLVRNHAHWDTRSLVEVLRFPILRQKDWVEHLTRGEVDCALNLDVHERIRAERVPGLVTSSRPAAVSQWFLLASQGPLRDVRVRRALNHALNRTLLVDVTAHGFGGPQRSVATEGQEGFTECEPYRYSPELARRLLHEAGHEAGFTLRGLVCETSTALFFMVREFLARVGVQLEAEIVPRGDWLGRIVGGNLSGQRYQGDFALASIDNPILHTLFHHFIFLHSHGPFSLRSDPTYDAAFMAAETGGDDAGTAGRLATLERYVRDEALVLFTVKEHVHAAFRQGFWCEMPRSGHFQMAALSSLRIAHGAAPAGPAERLSSVDPDLRLLLEGTGHVGTFFLKEERFADPGTAKVWRNLLASESRWRLEGEPMVRELVRQAEAKTHLANVLGSTERVAIAGYDADGRTAFVNTGYRAMVGERRTMIEQLGARWDEIAGAVAARGAWLGAVELDTQDRPAGAPRRLFLSVTRAVDHEGAAAGHTFVLTDFSGEEERIRHQAIRAILDNVPYGLCMCDGDMRVREGYSVACHGLFVAPERGVVGRTLPDLLAMRPREADHFEAAYLQIVDDFMPEAASLANLPERVMVAGRTLSLSAAVVRTADQAVDGVIFTIIDISALIEAEREVAALRAAMGVLRHRNRFEEFVGPHFARLHELARMSDAPDFEAQARRELHTAKGVFAQFGLAPLASTIHAIEDRPALGKDDLLELAAAVHALLREHASLWGIELGRVEARHEVPESLVVELEDWVRAAGTPEEMQRRALGCLARVREKTFGAWLGPVAQGAALLAERQGKTVRVHVEGADQRCPAALAELFAALPHLVRNAIDHGVEPRDERGEKPEQATLTLSCSASPEALVVCVSDDGRGIAVERVVARALELGLVSQSDVAQMDEAERLRLIFAPGLSTAHALTETSGRGVGMDAVDAAVRKLRGEISVRSMQGRGTRFELRIPRPAAL